MGIARCNRPLEHAPTLCRIALQPIAALEIGGAQGLSCMQIAGLDSALKPDAPPHRIAWDALAAQVDLAELGHGAGMAELSRLLQLGELHDAAACILVEHGRERDRKSTRLNSSH